MTPTEEQISQSAAAFAERMKDSNTPIEKSSDGGATWTRHVPGLMMKPWRLYRIASTPPWTLSRHLPGFDPLVEGQEWCQNFESEWTKEKLPKGYRPLLRGEPRQAEDEVFCFHETWRKFGTGEGCAYQTCEGNGAWLTRTKRPLPASLPPFWSSREDFPKVPVVWIKDGEVEQQVTKIEDRWLWINGTAHDWVYFKARPSLRWSPTRSDNDWRECRKEGK